MFAPVLNQLELLFIENPACPPLEGAESKNTNFEGNAIVLVTNKKGGWLSVGELFKEGRGIVVFSHRELTTHWLAQQIGSAGNKLGDVAQRRHPDYEVGKAINKSPDLLLGFMLLGAVNGAVMIPQFVAESAEVTIRAIQEKMQE